MRYNQGFTLVELLVVIAIIGTLVSMLLPAVQHVREAARRTQCANNVRQLAIALLSFESAHGNYPPGYASSPTSDGSAQPGVYRDPNTWDASPGWGWAAHLLPFIEGETISSSIDYKQPIWVSQHRSVVSLTLPVMLCPSAAGPEGPVTIRGNGGAPFSPDGVLPLELGRTHYVASHGQESCWGECGAALTGTIFTDIYSGATREIEVNGDVSKVADGPFFRNSNTEIAQVSDGTSNTIFLGEHTSRLSDKTWVGVVPGAVVVPRISTPVNGPDGAATLVLVHAGPSGGELDITGFPIIHPVNFPTRHVGQMYSDHPGGGNVGFGDGSVRFVPDSIDLFTFAELSSMNEGEVPDEW